MADSYYLKALKELAAEYNVRDARQLYRLAQRQIPDWRAGVRMSLAREALRPDVARQVLAPKPRSLGKSAAEGPNGRLQADLIDFSQNTRGGQKYALVVTDVFTREAATMALPNKRPGTINIAAKALVPELVGDEKNYVVTTDQGGEFYTLETALPEGAVHRTKEPRDRNAIAVVDRLVQTLKKDLAGRVARKGGRWDEQIEQVTEAYNSKPHEAVHAAPEDVEEQDATHFRVLQDNADKFKHNKNLTESRQRRLEEDGVREASPKSTGDAPAALLVHGDGHDQLLVEGVQPEPVLPHHQDAVDDGPVAPAPIDSARESLGETLAE